MKKLFLYILIVFLLLSSQVLSLDQLSESRGNGYIIKFKGEPILSYKNNLEKDIERKKQEFESKPESYKKSLGIVESFRLSIESKNIDSNVEKHAKYIEDIHSEFKKNLVKSQITGKLTFGSVGDNFNVEMKNEEILGEFKNIFNGIALDITKEDAKLLKDKLDYVEEIYPNKIINADLMNSVPLINADDVWNLGYTGEGVTIAIIDTGVDYTHSDLGGCTRESFLSGNCDKVIGGYDFVKCESFGMFGCLSGYEKEEDSDPMDEQHHGTHCAGISAGSGEGGLKGVAPDAKLYAYRVLNKEGSGTEADIISAMERALDPNGDGDTSDHVDVISMSLGGFCKQICSDGAFYCDICGPDDPESQAVDNIVESGIVVVVASGNQGEETSDGLKTVGSPGTARKAITVGASCRPSQITGSDETCETSIASFSSKGPIPWNGENIIKPDIVAPGHLICSSRYKNFWGGSGNCNNDYEHVLLSGTSMATPHVAGVVALILQKNPDYTVDDVKEALYETAVDLGRPDVEQGHGLVDAYEAVEYVIQSVTTTSIASTTTFATSTTIPVTPTTTISTEFPVTNFDCNSVLEGCYECFIQYPTSSQKAVMFLMDDADEKVWKSGLENIKTGSTESQTTFCCDTLSGTHKISYWVYDDSSMSNLITSSTSSQNKEIECQ